MASPISQCHLSLVFCWYTAVHCMGYGGLPLLTTSHHSSLNSIVIAVVDAIMEYNIAINATDNNTVHNIMQLAGQQNREL